MTELVKEISVLTIVFNNISKLSFVVSDEKASSYDVFKTDPFSFKCLPRAHREIKLMFCVILFNAKFTRWIFQALS